jgi:ParB-like chromosome segregation protein Spo0J
MNPTAVAVPLSALHPAPWNPRLIKDERFQNLCRSIADFLWPRPILAMEDGTIYAGNMRYRAVVHLGWSEVPAIVEDVPGQLAKERALRDNAQWGEWQEEELAELLRPTRCLHRDG